MKKLALLILLVLFLLVTATPAGAQCAPLGGLANLQWFANDGTLLQNGALYFFVAQSSTQAPTYSDFQCTQLNVNPLPFAQGARTTVWVPAGNFKMVLCSSSTDGPFCASGDTLFTIDNLQGASSGGGGGGGPNFTGVFISQTASPATSGTLRLSSGDSICWRNQAGSANLCWTKSSGDILQWSGGSLQLPEIAAPTCGAAGTDCLWADNTQHRIKGTNNGGTSAQYVLSGNDLGLTDQVLGVHFGSSQQTFGSTAPTASQPYIFFNGTNLVGNGTDVSLTTGGLTFAAGSGALCNAFAGASTLCVYTVWPSPHTLVRLVYEIVTAPSGCTTNAVVGLRDNTSSTNLSTLTVTGAVGVVDSGALSVSTTAGHQFALGLLTAASGCTTTPAIGAITAVYE